MTIIYVMSWKINSSHIIVHKINKLHTNVMSDDFL